MTKTSSVLIIEDDDWFAEQQRRILEKAGLNLARAAHGLEAIDMIDQFKPDVIILDIFLPGTNAITLLNELQSHADLANVPVVVCSNSVADLPAESLPSYGIRYVVDKTSMQPQDLVAAVRRVVS